MRKSFLYVAALALTFAACQPNYDVEDKTVATFEEAAITPAATESVFHLAKTGTFTSGNFEFTQDVADYGELGVYYFGSVVSNKKDNTYKDDFDGDKSVSGGACQGKNYLVWTPSLTGADGIKLKKAAKVPGMYVNNSAYAYASMTKGDMFAGEPFGDNDWLLLTVSASKGGKAVNTTVEFYLAKGKSIVTEWTYVDLSKLGEIDQLSFALTGSRTGEFGLNTPAYFCIDNLGAK